MTYKAVRTEPVSLAVPSWSTSFRIPCTLALILKTCSDNEDCKLINAASSRDCGTDEDGACGGCARPVSMSWKLIAIEFTRVSLKLELRWRIYMRGFI